MKTPLRTAAFAILALLIGMAGMSAMPLPAEAASSGDVAALPPKPPIHKPKVLRIAFDPIIDSGRTTLLEKYKAIHTVSVTSTRDEKVRKYPSWWHDPYSKSEATRKAIREATGGIVDYRFVGGVKMLNQWPYNFPHSENDYENMILTGRFSGDTKFDYRRFIKDHDLCGMVERGQIDEVWVYNAPLFGFKESIMVGKNGYWTNSQPLDYDCDRSFVIMGPSSHVDVGHDLHNFGHRIESVMKRVYGGWDLNRANRWHAFAFMDLNMGVSPINGCGDTHYAPNAVHRNYESYVYNKTLSHRSNCNQFPWYQAGDPLKTSYISCEAWGCDHDQPTVPCGDWECRDGQTMRSAWAAQPGQENYMTWWLSKIPRGNGCSEDGRLNDWWSYILYPDVAKTTYTLACSQKGRAIATALNGNCVGLEGNHSQGPRQGNYTDLIMWDCNGKQTQQWLWEYTGEIKNIWSNANNSTEMCFGPVGGANASSGALVHQWQCNGAKSQKWDRVHHSHGRYMIRNRANTKLCLQANHNGSNGERIRVRTCNRTYAQTFGQLFRI